MSEVMDKPVTATEPKKREVILVEPRLGLAEHKRQEWVVDAEEGTTMEDIVQPHYWAHVAGRFNPNDRIEVRLETGDWIADLIVVSAARNWARVHVAAFHDLAGESTDVPRSAIKHRVVWKGGHKKHCVLRIADGALIQEGLQTKALAEEWMVNHERVTAT